MGKVVFYIVNGYFDRLDVDSRKEYEVRLNLNHTFFGEKDVKLLLTSQNITKSSII